MAKKLECPIPTIRDLTVTAAELNTLAGVVPGTGAADEGVVIDASGNITLPGTLGVTGVVTAAGFTIGGAAILEAELEAADGITLGTGLASKFLSCDASGNATTPGTFGVTGVLTAGGITIGSAVISEAELEMIDGVTGGTVTASKFVAVDGSSNLAGLGTLGCGAITSTGATTLGSLGISAASTGITIDGAMTKGIYINPTTITDASMTPIHIEYDYPGASNTGVDLDNYGIRCAITQTSSNSEAAIGERGFIMGVRSDIHVDGFVDDAYAMYAKTYVDGASTLNQLYGLNVVCSHGANAISMDESGNYAGIGVSMNGTGDVTSAGTGWGRVSGMYINWNETNAMSADTCGIYLGVRTGSLLDSGYRVNGSGTLVSSFLSHNTGGTITNVIEVVGAHTYFANFDAATTCATTTESGPATSIKGAILVKTVAGATGYINVYGSAGN